MRSVSRILALALGLSAALVMVTAHPASAEPAHPTNYESTVTRVDPRTDGVHFAMAGGDAYLTVRVEPGHEVVIPGYFDEPYVRIDSDGAVFVNISSPAYVINAERFGAVSVPGDMDPDADPVWSKLSDDGAYAWHDHRTHWMSEDLPPAVDGAQREQVFPWEIPVVVDGAVVSVSGELVWVPSRNPLPAVMAGVIGLLPFLFWRPGRVRLVLGVSAGAAVIGAIVTMVLRSGTPSSARDVPLALLLPIAALIVCGIGFALARRSPTSAQWLALGAGAVLLAWVVGVMNALWLPVLPSQASPAAVRSLIAAVGWSSGAAVIVAIVELTMLKWPGVRRGTAAT